MKKKLFIAAVLTAMTIGGGTTVMAGRGPGGDHGIGRGPEMGAGGFFKRMAKVLKLTGEQQTQINSLVSSERTLAEPLREQMHEKRKLLMQAGESTTFDEASVRGIAASISGIEAELAVIRVRTQTQVYTLLTPDQRELLKNLRPDTEPPRPPVE